MASHRSLAGHPFPKPPSAAAKRLLAPLLAFVAGPHFDAELANGIRPSTSIGLGARADHITKRGPCLRVARALRAAIEAAERPSPPNPWDVRVPVAAGAIRSCTDEVLALAEALATTDRPPARGVAIARQLVFDGRSPLLLQAEPNREGADRRLASSVHAAQRALTVSTDLD